MKRLRRAHDRPPEGAGAAGRQARRIDALEKEMAVVRVDLDRLASGIRSIEERLDARDRAVEPITAGAEELVEARSLLEAVRSEHARVRARLHVVSRYEERIRRIEEAVVKLYGGDLRGPGPGGS
jgi:predicted  nucleic acid-binding Zn-ribbon protein